MVRDVQTLLSVKELALALGVSVDSIRRAYWKKEFPAFRICRMLRFDLTVIQAIIRERGLHGALRAGAVRIGDSRPRGPAPRPRVGNTGAQIAPPRRKNRGIQQQR